MRLLFLCFCFALLCSFLSGCSHEEPKDVSVPRTLKAGAVQLKEVKAKGLVNLIGKQQGKVVVVDFWATTCPVCMAKFPKLLQLQKAYGKDKVTCISASVDPKPRMNAAFAFLKNHQAKIPNVLLDTSDETYRMHCNFVVIPTVFVYDKNGVKVLQTNDIDEADRKVETLVTKDDTPATKPKEE